MKREPLIVRIPPLLTRLIAAGCFPATPAEIARCKAIVDEARDPCARAEQEARR